MTIYDMKELPHLVKPVTLGITILLFILMLLGHNSWFPMLFIILQLLLSLAIFLFFIFDLFVITHPMWPKVEMIYSVVFAGINIVAFIIVLIQMFGGFYFWHILELFLLAFLTLTWGFNAIQMWRGAASPSSSSNTNGNSNQATAAPPPSSFPGSGINPGV